MKIEVKPGFLRDYIREEMQKKNIGIRELSRIIEVPHQTISSFLKGSKTFYTVVEAMAVAVSEYKPTKTRKNATPKTNNKEL